ncbi:hypothetical protein [Paraburkholderia adhaesiva]|nr:hypothetical protein [Paraburkholderia adhaesiva]
MRFVLHCCACTARCLGWISPSSIVDEARIGEIFSTVALVLREVA